MFKVSGVSKHQGEVKVRFANDMTRVKILAKNGHEDINLLELPSEMDKPEIVKFLQTTELYLNTEFKIAIDEAVEKYSAMSKAAVLKTTSSKPATPKKAAPARKATAKTTAAKPAAKKAAATETLESLKARAAKKTTKAAEPTTAE